ncbi:hypothetical protein [Sphingomonas rubra]|uniref:Quinohemoprotein amine dehydrogenase A, alpha subunit, haem binding n=1 Tax=Sphingomonas rubra TaxID=634430 RepID=A0A1I5RNN1_9SPHN|nr:hypothetical protein [Sphingomonas rubra]SFP60154.1 Quinohemoprotein amine dehydrogenase A, alpha subunit, haem binding [Sphingomonas rubra]
MRAPSTGLLAGGVIALTAIVLVLVGAPHDRPSPPPRAPSATGVPASSVGARGVRLTSTAIELPADEAIFPEGPRSDLVNANCTACHSASMALDQPRLSAEQWRATVTKMREVYKAPVRAADVDAIVQYLVGMPGQSGGAPSGSAQDPAPNVPPSRS